MKNSSVGPWETEVRDVTGSESLLLSQAEGFDQESTSWNGYFLW